MRKIITLFILSFLGLNSFAQVSIKNSSFVYSKGTNLFVTNEINMDPNAKLYLRKEAQVLQLNNVANTGSGQISVFQEGTAGNFDYNYWSSPVSVSSGSGNQGFQAQQINTPLLTPGFKLNSFTTITDVSDLSTELVINSAPAIFNSSVDGNSDIQTITGSVTNLVSSVNISTRWLYKYNLAGSGGGNASYGAWQAIGTTGMVEPGYGFTMKGVRKTATGSQLNPNQPTTATGQRLDFRGRPNNGTITVQVATGDVVLAGNPYPSALDLKRFLIDNTTVTAGSTNYATSAIEPQVLIWEQNATSHFINQYEGGYGVYTPGDRNNINDNGMYLPAQKKRYDGSGNPIGNVSPGGPPPAVGITDVPRYAPVGQGFFLTRGLDDITTVAVDGFAPGPVANINFLNTQRVFKKESDVSSNSIFKSAPVGGVEENNITAPFVRPKIRINAIMNEGVSRQILLAFDDNSTDGDDWGLDAKNNTVVGPTDIYMPANGLNYIIQTVPFNEDKKIALGLVSNVPNTTYRFQVGGFENFDVSHVYLHDKQEDTYFDIKDASHTITVSAIGNLNDRYEITFKNGAETLSNIDIIKENDLDIFQDNSNQLLTVINKAGLDIQSISLYDLAGKSLINNAITDNQANYTYSTSALSTGIYIAKVNLKNGKEFTTKVSISK